MLTQTFYAETREGEGCSIPGYPRISPCEVGFVGILGAPNILGGTITYIVVSTRKETVTVMLQYPVPHPSRRSLHRILRMLASKLRAFTESAPSYGLKRSGNIL